MLTHPTVAFKWPSASTAQLVVSIGHRADPESYSSGSVVYLRRKASTNGILAQTTDPSLRTRGFQWEGVNQQAEAMRLTLSRLRVGFSLRADRGLDAVRDSWLC
jgi:hypothetical protein